MGTDMTKGSITKHIFRFAFPVALGILFQQLYNIVDTMIVGRLLGVNSLATDSIWSFPRIIHYPESRDVSFCIHAEDRSFKEQDTA